MRKRRGQTLVEALTALTLLGMIVPVSLAAFETAFVAEFWIQERTDKAAHAEWWFNKLEIPVALETIGDAPRTDQHGKFRFDWDVESGDYGTIQITLRVLGGESPYTETRIY